MQDLTKGSVSRHLLTTTGFMLVIMVFQTLYVLIDLYWVGRLGTEAVAAVSVAGNLMFVVLGLTQMLGVGTTTLIAHAAGRKDSGEAKLVFNQSLGLSGVVGVTFLVVTFLLRTLYADAMSADAETARLAEEYLSWFIPAMALQFPLVAMTAALRGVGDFRTGMIVTTSTVVLNMILAPFLIFGWVSGRPLGVAGAAISTLIAILTGVVWLVMTFRRAPLLRFDAHAWIPRLSIWRRMLAIGLPAGFEFGMMAVYLSIVYAISRPFGAAAQAGFGVGMRIIQAGFMPVVALGFSAAPVAGQNFGARLADRVRRTFRDAALMAAGAMVMLAIVCNIVPAALIGFFSDDPDVVRVGAEYLRIVSWSFIASGIIFVASSMFQAMGNTIPSLIASGTRIVLVAIPALALARLPSFELVWLWYLSVLSIVAQLALSLWMLRREFTRRLAFAP